ncbi:MAG: hypothetical protein ACPHCN_05090, partial [Mycobacterium sp.]
ELEGVSADRAPQIVAGALVAEASMKVLGIESVDICPWALREGLILRKLDSEADGTALVGGAGKSAKVGGAGKAAKAGGGGESASRRVPLRNAGQ